MILMYTIIPLVIGFFLDLLMGDPHGWWHPMIVIGNFISKTEKQLRKRFPDGEKGEFCAGIMLVVIVLFFSTVIPFLILVICWKVHWCLGIGMESVMCYYLLATKCLKDESMKVADALAKEGLESGRKAVSMIVGRDTQQLSQAGVIKAAVETVAENTSDGVIAPMLYMAIGGPVFGFFYKAVNTMDSMVGYKNEKYLYFGRAAAKLDDVVNYIPARITAGLLLIASSLGGFQGKNAWKIYRRDRRNHASPNSAQTESVVAGALGVQLAGDAYYFGKKYEKPTIGDSLREVEISDIGKANQLLYRAAWLCMGVLALISGGIFSLL